MSAFPRPTAKMCDLTGVIFFTFSVEYASAIVKLISLP